MRVDLSPYAILAFVLVVVAAVALAGLAEAVGRWAESLLRRSPTVAAVGLGLTAIAFANTLVPRGCGPAAEVRTRPLLAALSDTPCRGSALAHVALVAVAAAGTTVAVAVVTRHRVRTPDAEPTRHGSS